MSIQAVAWALEQDLPARPKLVLVSIANHANHVDGYCWLKAETIAAEASCSRRGVFNFVGDLIRNGYVRKAPKRGEDGKQRANDYWIVLDRAEAPWIKTGPADDGDAEEPEIVDADHAVDDAPEPQDVVDRVHPVHAANSGENTAAEAVDKPPGAPGPSAPACTHTESLEPSKTNPKESAGARAALSAALRRYQPPPPQPVGAVVEHAKQQIFVYEGSRAYEAWAKHCARQNGTRSWHLATRALIDGQWRSGWYFPTLFPPSEPATGPPS